MTPKYKLVPVEPTEEMINAVNWRSMGDVKGRKYAPQTYRAMIEAAPSPPHDPYKALEVAREALERIERHRLTGNVSGEWVKLSREALRQIEEMSK